MKEGTLYPQNNFGKLAVHQWRYLRSGSKPGMKSGHVWFTVWPAGVSVQHNQSSKTPRQYESKKIFHFIPIRYFFCLVHTRASRGEQTNWIKDNLFFGKHIQWTERHAWFEETLHKCWRPLRIKMISY